MALQKALFSTAEGIVAALNPATAPTAAGFFTAAGIYAGVAVAAGAGAAGIAAGQRGAAAPQAVPPGTAGSEVARVSGGGDLQRGSVQQTTIIVNGSVFDEGGLEEAITRGMRGAQSRGL